MNITNTIIFSKSATWSVINTLVFKYNFIFIKWKIYICIYFFQKNVELTKMGLTCMRKIHHLKENVELRTSRKSDNDPHYQGAMHLPQFTIVYVKPFIHIRSIRISYLCQRCNNRYIPLLCIYQHSRAYKT